MTSMAVPNQPAVRDLYVFQDLQVIVDNCKDFESGLKAGCNEEATGMLNDIIDTMVTEMGSSLNVWEINPFFSYPSI